MCSTADEQSSRNSSHVLCSLTLLLCSWVHVCNCFSCSSRCSRKQAKLFTASSQLGFASNAPRRVYSFLSPKMNAGPTACLLPGCRFGAALDVNSVQCCCNLHLCLSFHALRIPCGCNAVLQQPSLTMYRSVCTSM